jgi:hypothetical protein
MLNQDQQEIHSPNGLVKATEIPPFSGVIDSSFGQGIVRNYIKPSRAFLFSNYIFSKIQRRLAAGTNVWRLGNFAPYNFEPTGFGRQTPSEGALATEEDSVGSLTASPLQPLLFRTPVKNTLGQFDLQTARNKGTGRFQTCHPFYSQENLPVFSL